ncbi:hypothetical protein [Nocardia africana]
MPVRECPTADVDEPGRCAFVCCAHSCSSMVFGTHSAALLDEIGRCADRTKHAYTTGILAIADDIALLAPRDPASVRVQVVSVFAMMVGTLQLSRALSDRQLADEVLERGVRDVLAILNADDRLSTPARAIDPVREVGSPSCAADAGNV